MPQDNTSVASLKEIFQKFQSLKCDQQRAMEDDYVEVVFDVKDQQAWHKVLTDVFGPVAKPEGKAPTREDSSLTEEFGGVFDNQVLFRKDFNGTKVIAMLWPWGNRQQITLKMAVLKKK
ncbi:MAG: hypothetical protein WC676_01570 [Candidatus Omnitrophota bacterium]